VNPDSPVDGLHLESTDDGVAIKVRAVPGASRNRLVGPIGEALKVTVTAAPEKGKANRRIAEVLAKELGLSPRGIYLLSGSTSKDKRFVLPGVSVAELRRLLEAHFSP
jgi:uncharacterized protein (TIGR00251 family)